MAAVSATTSRPSRSRRSCRVANLCRPPLTMIPLGFGSAGFFYRRHRPHRDRHISRSQYEDGRRRAFRGSPAFALTVPNDEPAGLPLCQPLRDGALRPQPPALSKEVLAGHRAVEGDERDEIALASSLATCPFGSVGSRTDAWRTVCDSLGSVTEQTSGIRHAWAVPSGTLILCPGSTRPRSGHHASPRSAWRWRDRGPYRPWPW